VGGGRRKRRGGLGFRELTISCIYIYPILLSVHSIWTPDNGNLLCHDIQLLTLKSKPSFEPN